MGLVQSSPVLTYTTISEAVQITGQLGQRIDAQDAPGSLLMWGSSSKWHGSIGCITQTQLNSVSTSLLADGTNAFVGTYRLVLQSGIWQSSGSTHSFDPFKDSALNTKLRSMQDSGTGVVTIACIGESTTKGVGSAPDNPASGSWVRHFTRALAKRTGLYVSEIHIPQSTDGIYDNRWTFDSSWHSLADGPGCGCISNLVNEATASTLTFADPEIEWDTAIVFFHIYPAGGSNSAIVTATGGSGVTINNYAATRAVSSIVVTAAALSRYNVLSIAKQNNTVACYIIGIELYNSKMKQRIRVGNFGISRARTTDWIANSSTGIRGWLPITYMNPDCCILCLGGNESSNNVDAQTHLATIQQLITGLPSTARIHLLSITPRINDTQRALVDQYVSGYASLTGSNLVNYAAQTWGAWRNVQPPSFLSPSVHLSSSGYKYVADVIERTLLT